MSSNAYWCTMRNTYYCCHYYYYYSSARYSFSFEFWADRNNSIHLVAVRPCSLAPCRNGGTCYGDAVNFICVCPPNWTDRTCSTAVSGMTLTNIIWYATKHVPFSVVSLCSPNPCRNNGVCQTNGMVFACTCIPPWTGSTCENYQPVVITTTTTLPSSM